MRSGLKFSNSRWSGSIVYYCRRTLAMLVLLALAAGPGMAFDTGHHADLTQDVLSQRGFGQTAIQITQVENWLVDYFSESPTSRLKDEVSTLHFDNLFTPDAIRNRWWRFTLNTKAAAQRAASQNDPLQLLTVLGVSLHALQDFYSHSNWVELHPMGGTYPVESWFDNPTLAADGRLRTGAYPSNSHPELTPEQHHGNYHGPGINKDSYVRPRWDEAYVDAFAASHQWVAAVQQWVNEVNPAVWAQAHSFAVGGADRPALDYDLEASYRISEWIAAPEWLVPSNPNGHWKGDGSGSAGEFLSFVAQWTASPDSRFVQEFKVRGIHRRISEGLADDSAPSEPMPTVPRVPLDYRAVLVRTLHVAEKDDVGFFETKIDPGGKADFYARITVGGQPFVEAMQLDQSSVDPSWATIKFVPATVGQVPVRYELWDEDGGVAGDDDLCDINPTQDARVLNFTFAFGTHRCSGDVNGTHDSPAPAVQLEGAKPDSDRAIAGFYVTELSMQTPSRAVEAVDGDLHDGSFEGDNSSWSREGCFSTLPGYTSRGSGPPPGWGPVDGKVFGVLQAGGTCGATDSYLRQAFLARPGDAVSGYAFFNATNNGSDGGYDFAEVDIEAGPSADGPWTRAAVVYDTGPIYGDDHRNTGWRSDPTNYRGDDPWSYTFPAGGWYRIVASCRRIGGAGQYPAVLGLDGIALQRANAAPQ